MTIAEHSFDAWRLPERPVVLDVGCRGFGFGDGIRQLRPGAQLFELDIDDLGTARDYHRVGIAGYDGFGGISDHAEPFARKLIAGHDIQVYTLESFSRLHGVARWDIVKLDCEGSEFHALLGLGAPIADQISVEFHPWGGWTFADVDRVVQRLSRWYVVERHVKTAMAGMEPNYWDSLFIKRGL